MAEASGHFVEMEELLRKTGEYVAGKLGVDAALITAGASPGIIQSIGACIAGTDPYLRNCLPSKPPARSEVIIQRSHRNPYDNAVPTAGARFVEIGDCIKTHPWELEAAITENTAAVFFALQAEMLNASLSLDETLKIAHAKGIPVVVDAAAELPPKSNLWNLCKRGADLVIFSGGKEIAGPQSSGLVVGDKTLIDAARYNGAPNYGVGRPTKAGKENVMGFLAALEDYLAEDEEAHMAGMAKICEMWLSGLADLPGAVVSPFTATEPGIHPVCIPKVIVRKPGLDIQTAQKSLRKAEGGKPAVLVDTWKGGLVLNPQTITESEAEEVVSALKELFSV
jgi:L-seryl-tRNA(Ser) seleniumtransferase